MIHPFVFSGMPRIIFGPGEFRRVHRTIKEMGDHALVVTGVSSLERSGKWDELIKGLAKESIRCSRVTLQGEPSPDFVDEMVSRFRDRGIRDCRGIREAVCGGCHRCPVEGRSLDRLCKWRPDPHGQGAV